MTEPSPGRAPRARRFHPAALVVLTGVWVLLWDEISLFLVLTGLLVALLVGLVFPLPPIDLHGRFRPLQGLKLVARLLAEAFRASVDVVRLAFRFGTVPRSSIVRASASRTPCTAAAMAASSVAPSTCR